MLQVMLRLISKRFMRHSTNLCLTYQYDRLPLTTDMGNTYQNKPLTLASGETVDIAFVVRLCLINGGLSRKGAFTPIETILMIICLFQSKLEPFAWTEATLMDISTCSS
jgi:hypothetical protein